MVSPTTVATKGSTVSSSDSSNSRRKAGLWRSRMRLEKGAPMSIGPPEKRRRDEEKGPPEEQEDEGEQAHPERPAPRDVPDLVDALLDGGEEEQSGDEEGDDAEAVDGLCLVDELGDLVD